MIRERERERERELLATTYLPKKQNASLESSKNASAIDLGTKLVQAQFGSTLDLKCKISMPT